MQALPINRTATDLVVQVDRGGRRFPGYHRHVLGDRLRNHSLKLSLGVQRAYPRDGRDPPALTALMTEAEAMKLLVQAG